MQITVNQLCGHETPDQRFADDDAPVPHRRDNKQGENNFSGTFHKTGNQRFGLLTECLQRVSHIEQDTEHRIERAVNRRYRARYPESHLRGSKQGNQIAGEENRMIIAVTPQQTSMMQAVRIPLRIRSLFPAPRF